MITYPVRYNQDDECVEDSELRVIGHPFATVDEGKEVKHERGRSMADGLNMMKGYKPATMPEKLAETVVSAEKDFSISADERKWLSQIQNKAIDRIARKHRTLIKQLIAKAAVAAAKGAV